METEVHIAYICARDLRAACECFLVGGSVSESPQESRLIESAGLPIPFRAFSPSFYSSTRVPKFHPLLVCGCLYLYEAAAGWSLSENSMLLSACY